MSRAYTSDGKRRSAMTHANRSWECDCGRRLWGNGGKSSHQRACDTWARAELDRLERMLAGYKPGGNLAHISTATEFAAQYEARIADLRARLGITGEESSGDTADV